MKFSCRERIVAVEVNIRQRYRDVVRTAVPAETSYSMSCEQESLKETVLSYRFGWKVCETLAISRRTG